MNLLERGIGEYIRRAALPVAASAALVIVGTTLNAALTFAVPGQPIPGLISAVLFFLLSLLIPLYAGWSAAKKGSWTAWQCVLLGFFYGFISGFVNGIIGLIASVIILGAFAASMGNAGSASIIAAPLLISGIVSIIMIPLGMLFWGCAGAVLAGIGGLIGKSGAKTPAPASSSKKPAAPSRGKRK